MQFFPCRIPTILWGIPGARHRATSMILILGNRNKGLSTDHGLHCGNGKYDSCLQRNPKPGHPRISYGQMGRIFFLQF